MGGLWPDVVLRWKPLSGSYKRSSQTSSRCGTAVSVADSLHSDHPAGSPRGRQSGDRPEISRAGAAFNGYADGRSAARATATGTDTSRVRGLRTVNSDLQTPGWTPDCRRRRARSSSPDAAQPVRPRDPSRACRGLRRGRPCGCRPDVARRSVPVRRRPFAPGRRAQRWRRTGRSCARASRPAARWRCASARPAVRSARRSRSRRDWRAAHRGACGWSRLHHRRNECLGEHGLGARTALTFIRELFGPYWHEDTDKLSRLRCSAHFRELGRHPALRRGSIWRNVLARCGSTVDLDDPGPGAVLGFECGGNTIVLAKNLRYLSEYVLATTK